MATRLGKSVGRRGNILVEAKKMDAQSELLMAYGNRCQESREDGTLSSISRCDIMH